MSTDGKIIRTLLTAALIGAALYTIGRAVHMPVDTMRDLGVVLGVAGLSGAFIWALWRVRM